MMRLVVSDVMGESSSNIVYLPESPSRKMRGRIIMCKQPERVLEPEQDRLSEEGVQTSVRLQRALAMEPIAKGYSCETLAGRSALEIILDQRPSLIATETLQVLNPIAKTASPNDHIQVLEDKVREVMDYFRFRIGQLLEGKYSTE